MATSGIESTGPIVFDEFSKIRILDPAEFDSSEKLKEECKDFISKIQEFENLTTVFQKMMQEKANQIEKEKLKTIGARIALESEVENRNSQQAKYQHMIRERQAEFDRLVAQAESLLKVQQEQQAFIDSMSAK